MCAIASNTPLGLNTIRCPPVSNEVLSPIRIFPVGDPIRVTRLVLGPLKADYGRGAIPTVYDIIV